MNSKYDIPISRKKNHFLFSFSENMDRIISRIVRHTALNQTKCLSTATNSSKISNLCKKSDHMYGNEFGHTIKNEFRKDRWIRQHYRAPKGEDWRVKNGFGKMTPLEGSLRTMSNWSDPESGTPGAPLPIQTIQRQRMTQLAQDIFDAAMLVERAKKMTTDKS